MRPQASPSDRMHDKAVAFIAEVMRLENKVRDVSRQVDRVESELRQALSELTRDRFEECR
jgi:hypothetical protein